MKKFVLPLLRDEVNLPCYVYCVGGMEDQTPIRRPYGYPQYIWLHTIKGKGKLSLDGEDHILGENNGILVYPGVAHEYFALEQPWETHWVAFQGFGVKALLQTLGLSRSEVFSLHNQQLLDRLLNEIFISAMTNSPEGGLKSSARLYNFLMELIHCLDHDRTRLKVTAYSRLQPVLTYMEENYGGDLTLEQLAAVIGASPQYLCRIFKQSIKMSPIVYLTRLRLQKAKEILLDQNGISVTETGRKTGFHDTSYFCSVFKQQEGVTPLEFRRSYQ
jgi:AraC family transcriptional regulator of arabinose operon